ncbi:MAG: hypothetical protein U0736_06950 [Gemmataceae bacterium]
MTVSRCSTLAHLLAQGDQGAHLQHADRAGGAAHPRCHLLGRQLLEHAQQQHRLVVVRQFRQGGGQPDGVLAADGVLAGRRRVGGNAAGERDRRLFNAGAHLVERHLAGQVALLGGKPPRLVVQVVGEDAAEPGEQLRFLLAVKRRSRAVRPPAASSTTSDRSHLPRR